MTVRSDDPIDQRISAVEHRQDALERRLDAFEKVMEENTRTTNAIKQDTAQIVILFRASQLGATILKWCATVGGGAIVAYAAIRGLTH
jgi:hypothetical protein